MRRLTAWGATLALMMSAATVQHVVAWIPVLDARLDALEDWRPTSTCRVYDHQGDLVDEFMVLRRRWVDLADLPDAVWQAAVAAEDRRFFQHVGVDPLGIVRASLRNLASGGIREGGSTITQQVVKNAFEARDRTLARKVEEALLAWRLERRLGKHAILELYLNLVYLGSGNYGVEAAAQDYFGVPASELDAGQAALLLGLAPAPSRYSPRRSAEHAAQRRALVLRSMVDEGFLDQAEASRLGAVPVAPPRREDVAAQQAAGYLTTVRREVRRHLGNELPYRHGLRVHTPLDLQMQTLARGAVERAAAAVEARQGHAGPLRQEGRQGVAAFLASREGLDFGEDGKALAPEIGDCFPAIFTGGPRGEMGAGPYRWTPERDAWNRRIRSRAAARPPASLRASARVGDVYQVCASGAVEVALAERPWAEGAAVILEHHTGRVRALVGGRSVDIGGFVRATQARRQPGSAFKPFVFAAALEHGRTQVHKVLDAPLTIGRGPTAWSPRNYDDTYRGWIPLTDALARSVNTVAARLTMDVGPWEVRRLAREAGIRTPMVRDATIALGSSELTPLELATAYAMFSRGGVSAEPVFIDRLVDVLEEQVGAAGEPLELEGAASRRLPGGHGQPVVSEETAYQLVDMLSAVVTRGTGRQAAKVGEARAGKTGTTSGYADAWFVGATPTHTIAVWIGVDDRSSLGPGESGSRAALPAWREIADGLPGSSSFPIPDGILMMNWRGRWVGLPADDMPPWLLHAPVPGPEPLADFPGHRAWSG